MSHLIVSTHTDNHAMPKQNNSRVTQMTWLSFGSSILLEAHVRLRCLINNTWMKKWMNDKASSRWKGIGLQTLDQQMTQTVCATAGRCRWWAHDKAPGKKRSGSWPDMCQIDARLLETMDSFNQGRWSEICCPLCLCPFSCALHDFRLLYAIHKLYKQNISP